MSMSTISFEVQATRVRGARDVAHVRPEASHFAIAAEVVAAVVRDIAVDVEITVAGVTLPLACWLNPEHWESDWNQALEGHSFDDWLFQVIEGGGAA